uniref:Uncharacterized protein n=1 Tax=Knipowitschia caucasica TaxID=637954 RepID=A0AAV2KAC6_KNICA
MVVCLLKAADALPAAHSKHSRISALPPGPATGTCLRDLPPHGHHGYHGTHTIMNLLSIASNGIRLVSSVSGFGPGFTQYKVARDRWTSQTGTERETHKNKWTRAKGKKRGAIRAGRAMVGPRGDRSDTEALSSMPAVQLWSGR